MAALSSLLYQYKDLIFLAITIITIIFQRLEYYLRYIYDIILFTDLFSIYLLYTIGKSIMS